MALIGNNVNTLFDGLSAFWHRFFRDVQDIKATYEGTEILLGQVYLNLLSDVLNTDIVEAPLFRKEYYKLITIRADQIRFFEHGVNLAPPGIPQFYAGPNGDRYVFTSPTLFGAVPHLQNVIFSPTAALDEGPDYKTAGHELQFLEDPTSPVLPGYAQRQVTVAIGGKFTSPSEANWLLSGADKGDTLYFSETIDLGTVPPLDQTLPAFATWLALQGGTRSATIVYLTKDAISVSSDTPLPTFPVGVVPAGFSWRVIRRRDDGTYNTDLPRNSGLTDGQLNYAKTLEVAEMSLWAVDALVDDQVLYKVYGQFFTTPQASTEMYRALIRGLMQLYILGPVMARLESALNLTAGLPTIIEEDEVLQLYDSGIVASGTTGVMLASDIFEIPLAIFTPSSVGGFMKITASDFAENIGTFNIISYISPTKVILKAFAPFVPDAGIGWAYAPNNAQFVTTSKHAYEFPLETPMRADVKDPANFNVLTFRAFESLSAAIVVTDYIQDPEWWHNILIPNELMPDVSTARRVVTPLLYPNIIGPIGDAYIGDPGYYIGVDEDLHAVATPYRHRASFIYMDRFLKTHMFSVIVDHSVQLTGVLVSDLTKIIRDVKPVHTALYFRPLATSEERIAVTDTLVTSAHPP